VSRLEVGLTGLDALAHDVNVRTGLKYSSPLRTEPVAGAEYFRGRATLRNRRAFMPLAGHRTACRQWAALPLRLFVDYGFIAHGCAKVVNGP
jgi:hypothetical protein